EQGQGNPILFIHGIPTSSYLWRNVIPGVSSQGRCIALDLIGCGHSGKPNIQYTLADHEKFLTEFISKMGLKDLILVMHAWGGLI
ncbi:alpha/beta fold hydrolase, partial [Acinetobacter baumannii]